jgi:serine/threonine-protein kinase
MTKEVATPAAGVVLGRYRIETEVGRGGMGVVYACMDEPLKRRVAVKTLSAGLLGRDREARVHRFQREVKALSQLDDGGILHIYDAGEADDPVVGWVLYYAMELIEGETLSERLIRCGAMEVHSACAVVAKCAEALGSAHTRGIVHRDVKPANIFLAEGGRVVVADFGVCKIEGGSEITRKDQMVGTPSYLAPEQILGLPVDPRTDVFALGALLYVLATNSALRPQLDRTGLSKLAATDDAAQRALALRNVPPELPKVLAKALARDPADRYPDGAALAEALEPLAGRIPEPYEPGTGRPPEPPRADLGGSSSDGGAFTSGGTNPSSGPLEDESAGADAESPPPGDVGGDTRVDDDAPSSGDSEVLPALADEDGAVRPALRPSGRVGKPGADAKPRPREDLPHPAPPPEPPLAAKPAPPRRGNTGRHPAIPFSHGAGSAEDAVVAALSEDSLASGAPVPGNASRLVPPTAKVVQDVTRPRRETTGARPPPASAPAAPDEVTGDDGPPSSPEDSPTDPGGKARALARLAADRAVELAGEMAKRAVQLAQTVALLPRNVLLTAGALLLSLVVLSAVLLASRGAPPPATPPPDPGTTAPPVATPEPAALDLTPAPKPAACQVPEGFKVQPREVLALVQQAAALEKRGEHRKALSLWEKAVILGPEDAQAHLGMARCLKRLGDAKRSVPYFRCVAALRPGTPEAAEANAALGRP